MNTELNFEEAFSVFFDADDAVEQSEVTTCLKIPQGTPSWLKSLLKPAYNEDGEPNFIDKLTGKPLAGIYIGIENDVYHALDATSSTHLKVYADSPYKYQQIYQLGKEKKINKASALVGNLGHELVLEGLDAYLSRRFVLLESAAYSSDLHSYADLKDECARLGVAVSGNSYELGERIRKVDGAKKVFDHRQIDWLAQNMGEDFVADAKSKLLRDGVLPSSAEIIKLADIAKNEGLPKPSKLPVTTAVHNQVCGIIEAVSRNDDASKMLKNGLAEVTFITEDPSGMLLKCKADWLSFLSDVVIPLDLKTSRSSNPYLAAYQFADLRYDVQAAFYLRVIAPHFGQYAQKRLFPFVTVETGDFNICEIFELSNDDWEIGEDDVEKLLMGMKASSASDVYKGYTQKGRSVIKLARRKSAEAALCVGEEL